MEPFFIDCLMVLQKLNKDMDSALDELPQEALDWIPTEGANSLAVLAVHTAGSQRYWIGDVIAEEPSGRDREAEFRTRGLSAAELKEKLSNSLVYCQGVLDRLTVADLDQKRIAPRDGRNVSVGWALAHILEHTAEHVGHMGLTCQMWLAR